MKHYQLKKEFVLTDEHLKYLQELPQNLPETHLTKKQKDMVSAIYYKYISRNGIFHGWGTELYKMEQKEKWPSGPRVKAHEAQRFVISWLETANTHYKTMDLEKAAHHFYIHLTFREIASLLTSKIYECVEVPELETV